jgi:hypothetical protein
MLEIFYRMAQYSWSARICRSNAVWHRFNAVLIVGVETFQETSSLNDGLTADNFVLACVMSGKLRLDAVSNWSEVKYSGGQR